jgi:hypothetical protein
LEGFINSRKLIMAKIAPAAKTAAAPAAKTAPAAKAAPAKKVAPKEEPVEDAAEDVAAPAPRTRGPKGVDENAAITMLVEANPKRPSSKAFRAFEMYAEVNTVGEFINAIDSDDELKGSATGHLVYDVAHKFIAIEGYEPPNGYVEPKPKAEKPPKAVKEAKEPKGKPTVKGGKAKVDAEAEEETVE